MGFAKGIALPIGNRNWARSAFVPVVLFFFRVSKKESELRVEGIIYQLRHLFY